MLELLLKPKKAKPLDIFLISVVFSVIGVVFAVQIFPAQASVFSVSLITIMFMPFFQKMFAIEERKDYKLHKNLLERHRKLFYVFGIVFVGMIVTLSFMYVFFPQFRGAFSMQETWYSGNAISGHLTAEENFSAFFINNTQVLLMMFALSTIFGAGAVFILAWNASIISVYVGYVVQSFVEHLGPAAFFVGLPLGLGSIALHGIPEIGAYFVAALAGGMLSVAIAREHMKGHFKKIFVDSLVFLLFAEVLIILAAFLEAYV